ncbi:MAG: tetratricopeptide repeat protein [Muribaculaceae bacterium]|nr:tetratricopeptide repeat protein [Muribaculaceae bacterium]
MKGNIIKLSIFGLALFASATSFAQGSTDDSSQPLPPALNNTPSESYRNERNAIREGNKLFEEGQFHKAIEAYDRALLVNAGSIRARYNKARALLELQTEDNKGTEADTRVQAQKLLEELLSDARSYDKEVAEKAYYNLGNLAFNDGNYDASIEMYKDALRLEPSNMQTRENLRLAQLKKEQQENQSQDQNEQKEDKQEQQQQQQQEQQQQEQQQQQQQEQQPKPVTNSAQQILQSMQNKENSTRKKVNAQETPATGRPQTDKPW